MRTHCKNGHDLLAEGALLVTRDGLDTCAVCYKARMERTRREAPKKAREYRAKSGYYDSCAACGRKYPRPQKTKMCHAEACKANRSVMSEEAVRAVAVNKIIELDRELEHAPIWRKAEIKAQIQELSKAVG